MREEEVVEGGLVEVADPFCLFFLDVDLVGLYMEVKARNRKKKRVRKGIYIHYEYLVRAG